tara:strand:+ start:3626 stop:5503 length:1878 start_codon:yes stop_codon:yes gene_type:complete
MRGHSAVLILSGVVAIGGGLSSTWLRGIELRFAGVVQETRGVRSVPDRLIIVAIDDFSLQQAANADLSNDPLLQSLSQWPWRRRIHATVLDRLIEAGATAVAFDLLFESPSSHGEADDAAFAKVLKRHREQVVLGVQVLSSQGPVAGMSLLDVTPTLRPADTPIDRGLLNGEPDSDGVIRRRPGQVTQFMRAQLDPSIPDGLAIALLKKQKQAADFSIFSQDLLDPYGPPGTIPTLSIWELLEPQAYASIKRSGRLRNALVLVGPTAAVLQDLHPAVFSGAQGMPGVELHATELANRLDSRSLRWIPTPSGWNLVMAFLVIVAGVSTARLERPLARLGFLLSAAGLLVAGSAGLIVWGGVLLPVLGVAGSVAITGIVTSADATVRLQWQRRRLLRTLGRYLSPAVAAKIADQPEETDGLLGGQLMNVVILMSDIRGFTGFTQEMTEQGKVKELVNRLNQYFSEVVNAVHSEQGTVDKFIGDAVLAVFGAPLKQSRSANVRAAVRTALALQGKLAVLNRGWEKQGQKPWEQVIVLSHGWVLSGNIGCASRMDYTVIGDAVNTASRLETIAKQTGQLIVISAAVAEQLPSNFPLRNIGTFAMRGQEKQQVFALGTDTDADDWPDTLQ